MSAKATKLAGSSEFAKIITVEGDGQRAGTIRLDLSPIGGEYFEIAGGPPDSGGEFGDGVMSDRLDPGEAGIYFQSDDPGGNPDDARIHLEVFPNIASAEAAWTRLSKGLVQNDNLIAYLIEGL